MMKTENNAVSGRILSTPVGDIELFGDTNILREVRFAGTGNRHKLALTKDSGGAEAVDKAEKFLKDFFNESECDPSWKIRLVRGNEDRSVQGGDAAVIRCDVSGYSIKETAVYRALLDVGFGETVSYMELARRAGIPGASRFVGNCMAKNRFPLIVPCHRVIKSDGSIGNYGGGKHVKEALLVHEARRHCDS